METLLRAWTSSGSMSSNGVFASREFEIAGADPGGGGALLSTTNFFFSTNFLSICGLRHTGNAQGGGACECARVGVFFNFSEGG